jgi:hypothetical protein
MIREELSLITEALTPDQHETVMSDPGGFAGSLRSIDPRLKEAFFFPVTMVGKGSSSGSVFYKNLLIVEDNPAMLEQLKKNLVQAIQIGGIGPDDIKMVRTNDRQYWMRVSYVNPWTKVPGSNPPEYKPTNRSQEFNKLVNLDWAEKDPTTGKQKYVVMPKDATGQAGELTRGVKQRRLPKQGKVKIPGEYQGGKKPGRFSQLYKDTFGKLIKPFGAK